jgi:hypothetical protein
MMIPRVKGYNVIDLCGASDFPQTVSRSSHLWASRCLVEAAIIHDTTRYRAFCGVPIFLETMDRCFEKEIWYTARGIEQMKSMLACRIVLTGQQKR